MLYRDQVTLYPSVPPPSVYYWVRDSYGSAVHVYCDMNRSCGNITFLNVSRNIQHAAVLTGCQ